MQDIRGSVAVEGGAAAVRGNGNGRIFAAITRRSSDAGSDAALKKRVSLVGGTSSIESSQRDDASHNNSNMNKNNIIQHLAVTSNNLANMLKISTAKDFVGLSTVSPLVIPSDTCYKYPQDALYAVLSVGLIVIKHGKHRHIQYRYP